MNRTSRLLVALALALGMVTLAGAVPASAAGSTSIPDRKGDAPKRLDITGAKVRLDGQRLYVKINVRNLKKKAAFALSVYQSSEDYDTYVSHLTAWKNKTGKAKSRFGSFDFAGVAGPGDYRYSQERQCRTSVRWDAKRDTVRISVKRSGCVRVDPSLPLEVRVLSSAKVKDVDLERRLADNTPRIRFRAS